jgi:hypothetical protein
MYVIGWFPRYFVANVACTDIHAWIGSCIQWWKGFWPTIWPRSATSDKLEHLNTSGPLGIGYFSTISIDFDVVTFKESISVQSEIDITNNV